ncbi:unnamed protein product [Trichogramma brassicae]|uniref:FHOD1 N-terminal GTPase-binding domain-containing protein n=1 Tax=Trichogramma brassicae TaxID=86971 RepID=A0A6H5IAQ5_9HYME|nr:unnamed protein product [Trichogramma brassicae]
MSLTCRVQYLNDVDPFAYASSYPEPPRPPIHTFSATLPLINQLAAVHRLLRAAQELTFEYQIIFVLMTQTMVDVRDNKGNTPLHLALRYENKKATELLLKAGADPNLADAKGSTPLHIVSQECRCYGLAQVLFKICDELNQPLRVNARDKLGNTPLHYEAQNACHGPSDLMELLLRLGADPNLANDAGITPLHILSNGLVQIHNLAREIFRICNGVDAQDESDFEPLNLDGLSLLLSRGADPSSANSHGWTPLHNICKLDNGLVEAFLEICDENDRTLPINARNEDGDTPLHVALGSGNLVESLLRRGSDLSLANEEGSTPLHVICKREKDADVLAAKLFGICDEIGLTVPIDARDEQGRTPLQWAVANLSPKTVDILLDRGADLANFVFPTADYLADYLVLLQEPYDSRLNLKLKMASGVLVVVERLVDRGYEFTQDDALIIATVFARHGLFEKSAYDLEKPWYDDEKIARRVEIKIKPDLSLRQLVQLRAEEAEKVVAYTDYFEFARSDDFTWLSRAASRGLRCASVRHDVPRISPQMVAVSFLGTDSLSAADRDLNPPNFTSRLIQKSSTYAHSLRNTPYSQKSTLAISHLTSTSLSPSICTSLYILRVRIFASKGKTRRLLLHRRARRMNRHSLKSPYGDTEDR